MDRGYIKLWRKIEDSAIFQDEHLLRIAIWCLCKASHKHRFIKFSQGAIPHLVEIQKGQFVTGRNKISESLGWNPNTAWKRLKRLSSNPINLITIKSNKRYSVVTILNWDTYQPDEEDKEQAKVTDECQTGNRRVTDECQTGNRRVTDGCQTGNTNNTLENYKHYNIEEEGESPLPPPPPFSSQENKETISEVPETSQASTSTMKTTDVFKAFNVFYKKLSGYQSMRNVGQWQAVVNQICTLNSDLELVAKIFVWAEFNYKQTINFNPRFFADDHWGKIYQAYQKDNEPKKYGFHE